MNNVQVEVSLCLLLFIWPVMVVTAPKQNGAASPPRGFSDTAWKLDDYLTARSFKNSTQNNRSIAPPPDREMATASLAAKDITSLHQFAANDIMAEPNTTAASKRQLWKRQTPRERRSDEYGTGLVEPGDDNVLERYTNGISLRDLNVPDSYSALDLGRSASILPENEKSLVAFFVAHPNLKKSIITKKVCKTETSI
jgi:hypothetical protein